MIAHGNFTPSSGSSHFTLPEFDATIGIASSDVEIKTAISVPAVISRSE